jgi:hypothetical protein
MEAPLGKIRPRSIGHMIREDGQWFGFKSFFFRLNNSEFRGMPKGGKEGMTYIICQSWFDDYR